MLRKALEDNAAHHQQQQQQNQLQQLQQPHHSNDDDNDNVGGVDMNQVAQHHQQQHDIAYTVETTPLLIATPTSSANNDSYDDDNNNTTLESSVAVAASTASLSLQLKQQKQKPKQKPRQQSKEYGALLASATRLASVISNSDEATKRIVSSTTKITADATGKRHTLTNTNDIEQTTQSLTTNDNDDANDGYPTTDDDDDDDDTDGDNEEDDDDIIVERSWWQKTWDTIVTCFLIVANVENLWDSPPPPPSHIMDSRQQQRQRRRSGSGGGGSIDYEDDDFSTSGHGRNIHHSNSSTPRSTNMMYANNNFFLDANNRRRNNTIVLFWFVVLASSYAMERSTFKLLVDRVEPFRLMFAQFVTGSHATILGMGMLLQRLRLKHQQQRGPNHHNGISTYSTATTTPTTTATSTASVSSLFQDDNNNIMMIKSTMPLGIPLVDVGLMALLDSITLLIAFLSGSHVPPTLTVILVQFTIPLIAFLTQFIHPDGRFRCCVTSIVSTFGTATITRCRHNNDSLHDDPNDNNNSNHNGSSNATIQPPPSPPPPPPSRNGFGTSSYYNPSHQQQQHTIPEGTAAVPTTMNDGSVLRGWGGLSATHVWGSLILSFAVLLALVPAFYSLAYPDFFIYADTIPIRTAINTFLYVSSCFPAAASQLYKEHVFLQYKQPVNMNYLNLLLSLIQVMVAIIVTPLIYTLQGLGARRIDSEHDWTTFYPSTEFRQNYIDSIKCLFNILSDEEQEEKYAADALCKYSLLLILSYSISIISVGIAVDKIVNAGATKVMYRGISAGIIVAVVCMRYYDLHIPDFNYGPIISTLNLVCLLLLILGSEVYHRVTLQESTFETVYPEILLQSY